MNAEPTQQVSPEVAKLIQKKAEESILKMLGDPSALSPKTLIYILHPIIEKYLSVGMSLVDIATALQSAGYKVTRGHLVRNLGTIRAGSAQKPTTAIPETVSESRPSTPATTAEEEEEPPPGYKYIEYDGGAGYEDPIFDAAVAEAAKLAATISESDYNALSTFEKSVLRRAKESGNTEDIREIIKRQQAARAAALLPKPQYPDLPHPRQGAPISNLDLEKKTVEIEGITYPITGRLNRTPNLIIKLAGLKEKEAFIILPDRRFISKGGVSGDINPL